MPRTVVYSTPSIPHVSTKTIIDGAPAPRKGEALKEDTFGDKLVKYIPAEVIAFYVSSYILAGQLGETAQWVVFFVCLFGTPAYLFVRADKTTPPRVYFYLLAMGSFWAWAVGTSTVGADLFDWPASKAELMGKFIVSGAVFLIPLADELLTKIWPTAPTLPAPQPANS